MTKKRGIPPRPTIRDVAAHAGVSPTTVSHALSGKRPVAPETRARIFAAMEVLGYEPSFAAQYLAGKPSRIVALLFPLVSGIFSSVEERFLPAIGKTITEHNYALLIVYSPQMDMEQFRRFISSGVSDGVILMQVMLDDPRIAWLEDYDIPFVMIGRAEENEGLSYVDQDFNSGIASALDHLQMLGHREVAFLHYQDEELGFVARQRRDFLELTEARGLTAYLKPTDMSDVSAYRAMHALLDRDPVPTAIIVWNDLIVVGVERALKERGLRVPEDLSIICYDRSPTFSLTSGPLTIIDTRIDRMGKVAADMLLRTLKDPLRQPEQKLLQPKLIVGQSTGPAPA